MSAIVIADQVRIPGWVVDLDSFRRWARSEDYPEHGWFSYLDGEIWVDVSMEKLFTHNQVKTELAAVLFGLVKSAGMGYFFSDRALLSNTDVNLSTEPDGTFVSFDSIQAGQVRLMEAMEEDYVELEGTPDMVLEVVSTSSVRKDTKVLRELYWRAGIPEYWLVDVRKEPLKFDIFRHNGRGYVATRRQGDWLKSNVFGRAFKLETKKDRLGNPQYGLLLK